MLRFFVCLLVISYGAREANSRTAPNILLVVTDDQDVVLQGMNPMKYVRKALGEGGVTFSNAFTNSPLCCPSRASILSGMYAHNHQTMNNSVSGGCYGSYWRSSIETVALPKILQKNGYTTFFAGKYLNEYSGIDVPPGWDEFHGLHGNSKYYNYTLTENGKAINYSDTYLTDLIKDKSLEFLKKRSRPFFAMLAPPAPHAPFTPAVRHQDAFAGIKAMRTPNFNKNANKFDKHWLVSFSQTISSPLLQLMDKYYQHRWESLMAVDEMVEALIANLEASNELENTYIVFTSDNGYHIGQFAQPFDKRQPYETDIRVPLLVRGPGLPMNATVDAPVSLIDIFPTILEWAFISPNGKEDGQSFHVYMMNAKTYNPLNDYNFNRALLIQHFGEGNEQTYSPECPYKQNDYLAQCDTVSDCHCQDSRNNTFACIRHFRYKVNRLYCEFKDHENFVEAYEVDSDPFEMTNLGYEWLPIERALYSLALANLSRCSGASCRNVTRI